MQLSRAAAAACLKGAQSSVGVSMRGRGGWWRVSGVSVVAWLWLWSASVRCALKQAICSCVGLRTRRGLAGLR